MSFIRAPIQPDDDRSAASVSEQHEPLLHLFQIHEVGERVVVSTVRDDLPPNLDLEEDRRVLESVITKYGAQELAFDLSDLRFFSSTFLSLLVWFTRRSVQVTIFSPPEHLIQVLETTRLNELIRVVDTANEPTTMRC